MTKSDVIKFIDEQNKALVDPVAMLNFVWLRLIVSSIPQDAWETYVEAAAQVAARD